MDRGYYTSNFTSSAYSAEYAVFSAADSAERT